MGDPGTAPVARPAAQGAARGGDRAVVAGNQVGVGAGAEIAHAGIGLVDRVPAEPNRHAPNRDQALTRVELARAVHVVWWNRQPLPRGAGGLDQVAAGDAAIG